MVVVCVMANSSTLVYILHYVSHPSLEHCKTVFYSLHSTIFTTNSVAALPLKLFVNDFWCNNLFIWRWSYRYAYDAIIELWWNWKNLKNVKKKGRNNWFPPIFWPLLWEPLFYSLYNHWLAKRISVTYSLFHKLKEAINK